MIEKIKRADGVAAACERALIAGARAFGAGTRQQQRAAARRFIRRHRRDDRYLGWVLRSVGANSTVAVALLGLSPAPARAEFASFVVPRNGDPLSFAVAGPTPSLSDLDGDGDLDLLTGGFSGKFLYCENLGSASDPEFVFACTDDLLGDQDVGHLSAPSLGDLDGDGDLDLLAGNYLGTFRYFENTGTVTAAAFEPRTGTANPLFGNDVGFYSTPSLDDLDGDGDLDLVAGAGTGTFRYYENTGSATSPTFTVRTGAANPLNGQDVGSLSAPSFGDLDGDGDLDLVAGEYSGDFFAFENTGSVTTPVFTARTAADHPLLGHYVEGNSTPSLGDLDADGDLDLIAGQYIGSTRTFENTPGHTALVYQLVYQLAGDFDRRGFKFDFQDISATGTPILLADDEVSDAIPIGFPFDFYEIARTHFHVSSNGFLTFLAGQRNGCCQGERTPTAGDPDALIAGWWEDLNPAGGGSIVWQTLGTAPNRVTIVQFTQVPHFSDDEFTNPVTFQFKLFEGSHAIEVHYLDASGDGIAGIENDDGSAGLFAGFGGLSESAVRYSLPEPAHGMLFGTVLLRFLGRYRRRNGDRSASRNPHRQLLISRYGDL